MTCNWLWNWLENKYGVEILIVFQGQICELLHMNFILGVPDSFKFQVAANYVAMVPSGQVFDR